MPAKKRKSSSKGNKVPLEEKAPEPATVEKPELNDEYYEDKDQEKGEVGETDATEDIYDAEQREEMLADDEISSEENAFMEGSEMAMDEGQYRKKKKALEPDHEDTPSVELAKGDAKRGHDPEDTESY